MVRSPQGRYSPLRGIGLLVGMLGHPPGLCFSFFRKHPAKRILSRKLKEAMHKDRVIVRLHKGLRNGPPPTKGEFTVFSNAETYM